MFYHETETVIVNTAHYGIITRPLWTSFHTFLRSPSSLQYGFIIRANNNNNNNKLIFQISRLSLPASRDSLNISLSVPSLEWGPAPHPLALRSWGSSATPASNPDMDHNTNSRSPQPAQYNMHGSDAIRIPGLPGELSQQIAKYDSSEFDDDKEVSGGDAEGVWAPEIEQSFQ